MDQSKTSAVAFLAAAVLCLCLSPLVPIASDSDAAGASGEVLGVSYDSHSPTGLYEMTVEYYENRDLQLRVVDSTTREDTSESFHAVSISVFKLDGIDGDAHDDTSPLAYLYPFELGALQKVAFIASDLEVGFYHAIVRTEDGMEVVCAKFMIVDMIELRFTAAEGGTVREGSVSGSTMTVTVPKGSTVSMDGNSIMVKHSGETLHTITAVPPSGQYLDGWYVGDSKLTSGSRLTSDPTEIEVRWTSHAPTPDPTPGPAPDPTPTPDHPSADISVTTIRVPQGLSVSVPFTSSPSSATIGWTTSDGSVATVSDGMVYGASEGTATVSIIGPDGSVLATVVVVVEPPSETITEEETEYDDGGKVIVSYDRDEDGNERLINPIVIEPGDLRKVTSEQSDTAQGYMDQLRENGVDPIIIVRTQETDVSVPADLIGAIVEGNGSLTVIEGKITLFYSAEVLEEIGYSDDLRFIITPEEVEDTGGIVIDQYVLDRDPELYEVYMLRDGVRIILEDSPVSSAIEVTIEYPLEDWQAPDGIHVYYLDPDPDFEITDFTYDDGGIHFGVFHFCHYAIVYDGEKPAGDDDGGWMPWFLWIVLLLLLLLFYLIFLWKRIKVALFVEGGVIASVPEDWERESDDSISRRYRWHAKLELPQIAAVPPEGLDGHVIVGWDPEPPEKVTGGIELRCIWSEDIPPKLGDSEKPSDGDGIGDPEE